MTESRSGLSTTEPTGAQFRVSPDQRGRMAFAGLEVKGMSYRQNCLIVTGMTPE